jgi:hypothetical protein
MVVNQYNPFHNITMQGKDRIYRAFKDNPVRTGYRLFMSVAIPATVIYLATRDLEWFDKGSKTDRLLFFRIPVKGKGTWDKPDYILRIPKGHEAGVIIASAAERFAEAVLGEDPKSFDGFMEDVISQSKLGIIPQAMLPYVETKSNYSFFMQRPLIGAKQEGLLPELQFKSYTTELTKASGAALAEVPGLRGTAATSPIIIDNTVNALTGGLGRHIVKLADLMLRKSGALPNPPKPAWMLKDIPGIAAFISRNPSMSSETLVDFHENYKENQRIYDSLSAIVTMPGGKEAREEMVKIYGEEMVNPKGIRDAINTLSTAIQYWSQHPTMNPSEKRQLTDDAYWHANELGEKGNEFFDKIDMLRIKQIEKAREQSK